MTDEPLNMSVANRADVLNGKVREGFVVWKQMEIVEGRIFKKKWFSCESKFLFPNFSI